MAMCRVPKPRRAAAKASCLALFALLGAAEPLAASRDDNQVSGTHPACAAAVIPLENAREIANGNMLISGQPGLSLRRFHAVRAPRSELFPFQRFEAAAMRGTLSNGCPFQIWWSGNPQAQDLGEIRILSTVPRLDERYADLQLAPDPQPGWTPAFEGYRHVMSSAIFSGPSYIGLWNRMDGRPGSLVAIYDPTSTAVRTVGTSNWTYDGIYHQFAIHHLFFTVVDFPEGPGPLYIAVFEREEPGSEPPSRRRR